MINIFNKNIRFFKATQPFQLYHIRANDIQTNGVQERTCKNLTLHTIYISEKKCRLFSHVRRSSHVRNSPQQT